MVGQRLCQTGRESISSFDSRMREWYCIRLAVNLLLRLNLLKTVLYLCEIYYKCPEMLSVVSVEEKVLFMNEISRLHAICGDTHKCGKYITAAVDVIATDKNAMKCPREEEDLHAQVLHAAYMDIG